VHERPGTKNKEGGNEYSARTHATRVAAPSSSSGSSLLPIKHEETGSTYLLGLIRNRVVRRDLWRRISISQLLCAMNIKRVTNGQRVTSSRSGDELTLETVQGRRVMVGLPCVKPIDKGFKELLLAFNRSTEEGQPFGQVVIGERRDPAGKRPFPPTLEVDIDVGPSSGFYHTLKSPPLHP
jgi:hypothetical protein